MPDFKNAKHRTQIKTVLGLGQDGKSDPLVLSSVKGEEYISRPFRYELTLLRPHDLGPLNISGFSQGLGAPNPRKTLLGTPARITTRLELDANVEGDADVPIGVALIHRFGVFASIEESGLIPHFFAYRAVLVPAFQMLDHEVLYRVFENLDVLEILENILIAGFPNLHVDFHHLQQENFPKIEYCVQFGESTYNFASRLMARFGIWYYFRHDGKPSPNNETLVLQRSSREFLKCEARFESAHGEELTNTPPLDQLLFDPPRFGGEGARVTNRLPSVFTIGFPQDHTKAAAFTRTVAGDFNPLQPVSPFDDEVKINSSFDVMAPENAAPFEKMIFPVRANKQDQASDYAKLMMELGEARVFTLTGHSRNPTFCAGAQFGVFLGGGETNEQSNSSDVRVDEDPEFIGQPIVAVAGKGALAQYVLTHVSFSAYDGAYTEASFGEKAQMIGGSLFQGLLPFLQLNKDNFALTSAAQGLNNYLKTIEQDDLHATSLPSSGYGSGGRDFGAYFAAAAMANVTTLLPSLLSSVISGIDKALEETKNEYSNSFEVIGFDERTVKTPVLPVPREFYSPVAHGPHLAVVIGEDGVDVGTGEVFADALGRVRVRFPWDRKIGVGEPAENPGDQFKRGKPACWVRVSEGWAGRHFGTQFLPRIGQEVIVSFIDGDPERPIITGRVYNAGSDGTANLPFPNPTTQSKSLTPDDLLNAKGTANFRFTGIKTQSTGAPGDAPPSRDIQNKRFHLLRFDDTYQKEQYLIRSQHRLDITALEKRYESIGSDRHLTVGGKRPPPPGPPAIGGSYFAKVFQHYHLHVGDPDFPADSGNRITLIEQNDEIEIVKDSGQSIGGNWSADVGGQATVNAAGPAGTIVLNAALNITLTVGASSIVITPAGISITAPVINLVAPAILSTVPVVPAGAATLPPGVPIPPEVRKPDPPTAADPGDTLTPPE